MNKQTKNNSNLGPVPSSKNQVNRTCHQGARAFTLVELIVVITILAILWTIAFISLQWYSKDARNSVRLSDLSNIDKMLWIKIVTAWKVPLPDDYVEITASGTVLNYQGEAWENVLNWLWVFNWWKDPKDETYYTYSTNTTRTKYQLLWFLEWDALANNTILWKVNAVTDLSERQVRVYWNELWIILDNITNIPVATTVDVVNTTDTYKVTFTDWDLIEWTWTTLFSNIYNRDENLLDNKELAKLDDSLVWYWDMETITWWLLEDLSQYWNNWTLSGWILIWWEEWKSWNATYFDWNDDLVEILSSDSLNPKNITISAIVNHYWTWSNTNTYPRIVSKWWTTNSEEYAFWYNYNIDAEISNSFQWRLDTLSRSGTTLTFAKEVLPINDRWMNISVVYDGIYFKLYVDGELYGSFVWVFEWDLVSSIKHLIIWNAWWDSWYNRAFYWLIDDIRIYSRALSDSEIQTLYNSIK